MRNRNMLRNKPQHHSKPQTATCGFTIGCCGLARGFMKGQQSATGRILEGSVIDENAQVKRCRSCNAAIVWGRTATGKPCPFDYVDGAPTQVSHFSTCPDAAQHRKR